MNTKRYSAEKSVVKIQNPIELFDVLEDHQKDLAQIAHLYLYLSEFQWKSGDYDGAFASLEAARERAACFDAAHHSHVALELPDVWPWRCVPDYSQVAKEMQADARWVAWAKACKGD